MGAVLLCSPFFLFFYSAKNLIESLMANILVDCGTAACKATAVQPVYQSHCISNLFIYQAIESSLVPARVSDSPVSAENFIYEAFVVTGEL